MGTTIIVLCDFLYGFYVNAQLYQRRGIVLPRVRVCKITQIPRFANSLREFFEVSDDILI